MRYFVHLAYHGKPYHGWQKQPNAHSVQEEIESKLSILLKTPIQVVGCGRTDTGVHAKQYYLHMDLVQPIDTEKVCFQLNAILPKDIAIFEIFEVKLDLHARFSAISRQYEYWICRKANPFAQDISYFYSKPLHVEAMNQAALLLLGSHDFECFSKVHTDVKTFICDVRFAQWQAREDGFLVFTIEADRFLRNMVRAIVGTLLEVGKGKVSIDEFKAILQSKNRSEAGMSVAAQGLFLSKISYDF
ncbi:MAG: tRNA pseudouridine(38-40) synthase TruA [Bacteroidia bacterium]|nr:tRNA pseudouridine(38-40) synthase TruA [Bacteroidia bacterium]